MTKIITASLLSVLTFSMLLPVTRQVNAASVNHSIFRQGGVPMPGGSGGGHYTPRQGGVPMPGGSGGGHYTPRQGGVPMPGGSGGGH